MDNTWDCGSHSPGSNPGQGIIISVIIMLNANTYVTSQKGIGGTIRIDMKIFTLKKFQKSFRLEKVQTSTSGLKNSEGPLWMSF